MGKSRLGKVANVLDCDIGVSKFKIQSRYTVDFLTNTLEKDIKSFNSLQAIG